MRSTVAVFAVLSLQSTLAIADYFVTGPIKGNVCWGVGIEVCGMKPIHAVKGSDGKMYELADRFKSVTEYNAAKGRCWIRTKSTGGGLISFGINTAIQPDFYERNTDGSFKKLDVEYVSFPCTQK